MSNKVHKIAKDIVEQKGKLKEVPFKVNFVMDATDKYSIVIVSGVPEDLDPDDPLIKHTAEQQFVNVLNSRMYLETYGYNEDHRKDYPTFRNLMKVESIQVKSIERIE